jgi:membrane-bound serine protease (ClpP class)
MTALGFVLLLMGATLVIAEAHLPGGVLGVAGGIALIAGGIVVIGALGGGAALAIPVGVGLGLAAGAWVLLVMRGVTGARRVQISSGSESLCGQVGVVRQWHEPDGQVFVHGALWRARHRPAADEADELREGDRVVVDVVDGLTLSVRRAEDWELIA